MLGPLPQFKFSWVGVPVICFQLIIDSIILMLAHVPVRWTVTSSH